MMWQFPSRARLRDYTGRRPAERNFAPRPVFGLLCGLDAGSSPSAPCHREKGDDGMKQAILGIGLCGLVVIGAGVCWGQPPEGRPGFGPPGGPPGHPILMLLDSDRNGELSSDEITAAADVLRKLDRNQ